MISTRLHSLLASKLLWRPPASLRACVLPRRKPLKPLVKPLGCGLPTSSGPEARGPSDLSSNRYGDPVALVTFPVHILPPNQRSIRHASICCARASDIAPRGLHSAHPCPGC